MLCYLRLRGVAGLMGGFEVGRGEEVISHF